MSAILAFVCSAILGVFLMSFVAETTDLDSMLHEACRRLLTMVVALLPADYSIAQKVAESNIVSASRACHAFRDLVARTAGPADPADTRQRVDAANRKTAAIAANSRITLDSPETLSLEEFKKQVAASLDPKKAKS